MVMKLHGSPFSTCTQRVLTVLAEKGVTDFEIVTVNLPAGAHKREPHISMQPFGRIPALEDDGFVVYESRAICRYIAAKYAEQGNQVMPNGSDLKALAIFEQGCSVELAYFDGPASKIGWEKVFKLKKGAGETDEAKVAEYTADLDATFAVYEKILSKQGYLGGSEVTLADLFHLSYCTLLQSIGMGAVFEKYPTVKKWLSDLQARESWKKVSAAPKGP